MLDTPKRLGEDIQRKGAALQQDITQGGREFVGMVQFEGQKFKKKAKDAYDELQTSPNQHNIDQYLAFKKAKIKLSAAVIDDFKKVYKEQLDFYNQRSLEQNGLVAKAKKNFSFKKAEKEIDKTEIDRNKAQIYLTQLGLVNANPYKHNLNTSLSDLERAIGYSPGANFNLIGASLIGIGILSLGVTKFAPKILKVAMFFIGVCSVGLGILVLSGGCRKRLGNSNIHKEVETLLAQQELKIKDEINDVQDEIKLLRKNPHTTFADIKLNFEKWNTTFERCFKEDMDNVLNNSRSK